MTRYLLPLTICPARSPVAAIGRIRSASPCEDLDREPAPYPWIPRLGQERRRRVTTMMAMPGIVRRASSLPIALQPEMTASALLLAPGARRGWHGRGRRKNNVGDLARTRYHHCVACAGD